MSKGIGKEFMLKTQYEYLEESDQSKGLPQPPLQLPYDKDGVIIDLPSFSDIQLSNNDLIALIKDRKSLRKYSEKAISLKELSYLLWATQGVKEVVSRPATLRTVPSAGARHAFETYLLVNNVEGLQRGVYRYLAIENKLIQVNMDKDMAEKITEACLNQVFVKTSGVTFIWVAVVERMKWRYGERGYRFLHLDGGHVCQNLYLAAESIDCGTCAIAAYEDKEINKVLNLDGEEQFVIYISPVGKK